MKPNQMKTLLCIASCAAASISPAAWAVGVPGQGTWETTLQARDADGDGTADGYYDTVLRITWLANANALAGTAFDASEFSSASDGRTDWANAVAWAAQLNVHGVTGWRLPTQMDTGLPGCGGDGAWEDFAYSGTDCGFSVLTFQASPRQVFSEMAHMYYVTLANLPYCDTTGDCSLGNASPPDTRMLSNTGPFRNLQSFDYWGGLADAEFPDTDAWYLGMGDGLQTPIPMRIDSNAWAVIDGDVLSAVPEPGTWALWLAGLGAVGALRQRRHAGAARRRQLEQARTNPELGIASPKAS